MRREITIENGWFAIADDPEQIIGAVLKLVTNNRNRGLIAKRLAPNGDGFHLHAWYCDSNRSARRAARAMEPRSEPRP